MSNHPVHIVDIHGNISSSAFIPFCSLAGNMSILGKHVENFKFPVCSMFKPKILFGELCYQLNINDIKGKINLNNGVLGGLSFAMDYNEDRRLAGKSENEASLQNKQKALHDFEIMADNKFKAKIEN